MSKKAKKLTYDPSQFTECEYDVRYEAKGTKFYQLQLQGTRLASTYGKIGAEKPQSTVKEFDTAEKAKEECAKLIHSKTTGTEKYEFKEEKGSKKVSELPMPEKKTSARGKKPAAAATAEEGGEEEEAGKKRGRGEKDEEIKTEETSSDAKKAKHDIAETAGTKDVEKVGESTKMDEGSKGRDIPVGEKEAVGKVGSGMESKPVDESKMVDVGEGEKVGSPASKKATAV